MKHLCPGSSTREEKIEIACRWLGIRCSVWRGRVTWNGNISLVHLVLAFGQMIHRVRSHSFLFLVYSACSSCILVSTGAPSIFTFVSLIRQTHTHIHTHVRFLLVRLLVLPFRITFSTLYSLVVVSRLHVFPVTLFPSHHTAYTLVLSSLLLWLFPHSPICKLYSLFLLFSNVRSLSAAFSILTLFANAVFSQSPQTSLSVSQVL